MTKNRELVRGPEGRHYPSYSHSGNALALFDDGQRVAGVDHRTFRSQDLLYAAILGRFHLVLHLHGFHHDDALAGLHFISLADQDANNLTRHGRLDLLWAGLGAAYGAAGAQGARVLDIHGIARAADHHVQFALQRALALDLVGFAADQHRHHVASGERGVHLDLLAVHLAQPGLLAAGQLQLMRFAVYHNVVDGKTDRKSTRLNS